jgi:hypothetical protein
VNSPVLVYGGLEGAGTQPGGVLNALSVSEWKALRASGAMEANVLDVDGAGAAVSEQGAESESREMQEGEKQARHQQASHSGSRSK